MAMRFMEVQDVEKEVFQRIKDDHSYRDDLSHIIQLNEATTYLAMERYPPCY